MSNKYLKVCFAVAAFLLVVSLVVLYRLFTLSVTLQKDNYQLNHENRILKHELTNKQISGPDYLQELVADLKKQGLNDPLNDLKNDLINKRDLIPYRGLRGSRTFFTDDIYFLRYDGVLATFEDGHFAGYLILKYAVNNGTISWEVVGHCLDGMSEAEYQRMLNENG